MPLSCVSLGFIELSVVMLIDIVLNVVILAAINAFLLNSVSLC